MPPTFRQITLTSNDVIPLVVTFTAGIGGNWYNRGYQSYKASTGKTLVGSTKVAGPASKEFFIVTVTNAKAEIPQVTLLEAMWQRQQANPSTYVITLKDEFESVDAVQAGYNSRSVVTTVTIPGTGGLQRKFVQYPVFLTYLPDKDREYLGAGFYKLSFTAEEV